MIRRASVFSLTALTILLAASMVSWGQSQSLLTRHTRDVVVSGEAQSLGRLPASKTLQLDVMLALRHQPELKNFIDALYEPGNPSFHHFLSVEEFTARFGPTQDQYDAVTRFAKENGFKIISEPARNRMVISMTGSVGSIEKAFHVELGLYQHPTENRSFYAPDREPSVDLPFQLWHVDGLENYSIPRPAFVKKPTRNASRWSP